MKSRFLFTLGLLFLLPAVRGAAADPELKIDLGKGVSLEMVLVKKGQFREGSAETEGGRGNDETQRDVTLTKDFYMAKYPVTVAQFRRFVEDTGYLTEAERGSSGGFGLDGGKLVQRKDFSWKKPGYQIKDDCPVTMVTYDDAFAFVYWLRDKSGRKFTLPTEAQWEYACRAGTTTPFYNGSGDTDLDEIGWYAGNSNKAAQPVGKKKPNAFGLYDMSGNVFQWCRDWYGPYGDDATDPLEARSNLIEKQPPRRVLRGGSWFKAAHYCRSASRWRSTAASRNADNGMRVMIEVDDDTTIDGAAKSSSTEKSSSAERHPVFATTKSTQP
jgi:formylglycine-generating enzyme required for sulfatase activity